MNPSSPRADNGPEFDPACTACPRLKRHLATVRRAFPTYYTRPVPPFGDRRARLLIVGLAPGKHGANATGRPFTGDHAGIILYRYLHRFGFADRAESRAADDGLALRDCRITNAVKCLPPDNKPSTAEIATCNRYLRAELNRLKPGAVILALGTVAHKSILRALDVRASSCAFRHGAAYRLPNDLHLVDSYHCSRYNTQTRRLTEPMFAQVFTQIAALLGRVVQADDKHRA